MKLTATYTGADIDDMSITDEIKQLERLRHAHQCEADEADADKYKLLKDFGSEDLSFFEGTKVQIIDWQVPKEEQYVGEIGYVGEAHALYDPDIDDVLIGTNIYKHTEDGRKSDSSYIKYNYPFSHKNLKAL